MHIVECRYCSQVLLVPVVCVFLEAITAPATMPAIAAAIRRPRTRNASVRNLNDLQENHLKQKHKEISK